MSLDPSYAITPLLAWLVAGILKFAINSLRAGKPAFDLIGYGGLPSNHSTIVTSMAVLIALKEGISHPAFGVALCLAVVVMMDAVSLRGQVGRHAATINRMAGSEAGHAPLRERIGHSRLEIAAGVVVGTAVALGVCVLPFGTCMVLSGA